MSQTLHPSDERLLRLPAVIDATGFSRSNLYRYIQNGDFPKPVKTGRMSAWLQSEVREWIDASKRKRDAA